jgi:hypothetical protein
MARRLVSDLLQGMSLNNKNGWPEAELTIRNSGYLRLDSETNMGS